MSKCTCKKCIAGYLSPRNCFRMKQSATQCAELIRDSMPNFPDDQPVHDPEVYLLDFCPPEVRMEVHKNFVLGFANCFDIIAYVLKQEQFPKPRMIQQCAGVVPGLDKQATSFYLSNGGTVEYVLDALLSRISDELETLSGDELAQDEGDNTKLKSISDCANDSAIEILRQQLFSTSDFWPCGPYPMDDEGGFDDGDDDGWVHYDTSNWKPPAKQ